MPGFRRGRGPLSLVSVCVLFLGSGCGVLQAGRLLQDALGPHTALEAEVEEHVVQVQGEAGTLAVHLTRPRGAEGALPAILLVHGAVPDGALDPRLVGLARALAVRGATVASPDLTALRRLRFDGDDPHRIRDAVLWLAGRRDLTVDGRVAVLAISVGGSYALLAAAEPALAERLSCLLAFGSYADLEPLLLEWLAHRPTDRRERQAWDETRGEILLGNLERLVPPEDLVACRRVLRAGLVGPVDEDIEWERFSPRGRLALAAARSEEPLSRERATSLIEPLQGVLAALSPANAATLRIPAPVFLLHGAKDPLIGVEHSRELAKILRAAGTRVVLHVTDLFGHVDAPADPSLCEAWPLLVFVDDVLDEAGL